MWPSVIVVSRYLIINPHRILVTTTREGRRTRPVILELGAGCGLVGITAARVILASRRTNGDDDDDGDHDDHYNDDVEEEGAVGRSKMKEVVVITDVNDTVLENIARNVELNDDSSVTRVSRLDFYNQAGDCRAGRWIATERVAKKGSDGGGGGGVETLDEGGGWGPADVVLAADIICKPDDAIAASKTIYDALRPGGVALVVCANAEHRYGVEIFASECEERSHV
jgi:predicted nicotinamide N-methyase